MKNVFYFLIIVLLLKSACSNDLKKNTITITLESKIDSVLLYLAKEYELPCFKLINSDITGDIICDSTKLKESFPLFKKVYYPYIDLTFEFRQSYDCHQLLEIIICYNDSIIYGIPFRDNYYYWRYRGNTSEYVEKLSFEAEINNAIYFFIKNKVGLDEHLKTSYAISFVRAIMDNLTKFYCREVFLHTDDFEAIKMRTKNLISERYFPDQECKDNALLNIEKLENELKTANKNYLLYYFMMNDLIYYFTFEDFSKTGKYVSVNVVNKECYFEIIF